LQIQQLAINLSYFPALFRKIALMLWGGVLLYRFTPTAAFRVRRREKGQDNGISVEKRESLWYSIASNNLLYFYI